jgi:acetylornithine/succinyldiaminopimelate/putrescine aminotransferase
MGSCGLMTKSIFRDLFEPHLPGVGPVPFGDLDALAAALSAGDVAAVIVEPIQLEGGVRPLPPDYLAALCELTAKHGTLLVADEVQTGLGRTGRWFGHQHHGVVPDVVTIAKALGNGVPIGACWAKAEVAAAFEPGDHATTFGGQPLATAAARAVLAEMQRLDVPTLAEKAGARLTSGLEALPGVVVVRGLGLLIAAQLADGIDAKAVAATALERGLVLNAVTPTALRFAPPLTVSDDEIDRAVALLGDVLAGASP